MSNIFGELRSVLAKRTHRWVMPFYVPDHLFLLENEIASVLVMYPHEEYTQALQYLCTLPQGTVNLRAVCAFVEVHPLKTALRPEHFPWGEHISDVPDTMRSHFSYVILEKSSSHLFIAEDYGSSVYNPHFGLEVRGGDVPTAFLTAFAEYSYSQPGNPLYLYNQWVKKGNKPSQFGLISPDHLEHWTVDDLEISQEDLEKCEEAWAGYPELCLSPEPWHSLYAPHANNHQPGRDIPAIGCSEGGLILKGTFLNIYVPDTAASTLQSLLDYVKMVAEEAWEAQDKEDFPLLCSPHKR